ncbi:MAG: hypothetical protein QXW22_03260 [Candidatus Nanoarchaeia archaeon]|nr:hypothetical protein [Candidatus Haiyanarchaeum thermophilum]
MHAQTTLEYLVVFSILIMVLAILAFFISQFLYVEFRKEYLNFYQIVPVDWVLFPNGTFIVLLQSKLPYQIIILKLNAMLDTQTSEISVEEAMEHNETKNFTLQFSGKTGNYEISLKISYRNTLTNEIKVEEGILRGHT